MADPLTVLGAFAAASQVLEQTLRIASFIYEVYNDIQDVPDFISNRLRQIEQLAGASKAIQQSLALQTDEVAAALRSCMYKTTKIQLQLKESLPTVEDGRWRRLQKSLLVVMRKKDTMGMFEDLEREKSSLMLCIQAIEPGVLQAIVKEIYGLQTTASQIAKNVSTVSETMPIISKNVEAIHNLAPAILDKVDVIHDTLLPTLMQQLSVHQQTVNQSDQSLDGLFEIPQRRVRGFVGREDILEQLGAAIQIQRDSNPGVLVIQGLGGQGKTQVALEFCQRAITSDLVEAVFWIDAASEVSLTKSFEAIYAKIKPATSEKTSSELQIAFVMKRLATSKTVWLMVFDNFDDPISFSNIQDFFPASRHGTILVTSRHTDTEALADDGCVFELSGLQSAYAIELLLKRSQISSSKQAVEDGKLIVNRLGYHALAIVQAGTYINKRRIQLNQFLDHYNRRRMLILRETPRMSQYRRQLNLAEKETSLSVFTTWELSLQQLMVDDPGGSKTDLLTLLAFFDYKDVSEELMLSYCNTQHLRPDDRAILFNCLKPVRRRPTITSADTNSESDDTRSDDAESGDAESDDAGSDDAKSDKPLEEGRWDTDKFSDTLADLRQLSLIQSSVYSVDGFFHVSLHPLVNDWIKLRTTDQNKLRFFELASRILHHYSTSSVQELSARHIGIAHLAALDDVLEGLFEADERQVVIPWQCHLAFEQFGDFLCEGGRYSESVKWFERVLRMYTLKYGPESKRLLHIRYELSNSLIWAGELEKAEASVLELIKSRDPLGENNVFGRTLLALIKQQRGYYSETEKLHRNLVSQIANSLHKTNLGVAMNNLGNTLISMEKYKEAEEVLSKAYSWNCSRYGDSHRLPLEASNNHVMALKGLKRFDEAKTEGMRLIAQSSETFGFDHPLSNELIDTLAQVLFEKREYKDARTLCIQALNWRNDTFGSKHRKTLESLDLMAKLDAAEAVDSDQTLF